MPYTIAIEHTFFRVTFVGALTSEDLRAFASEAAVIEEGPHGSLDRLADLSQVTGAPITYAEVQSLVQSRKASPPRTRVRTAIVATTDVLYGFSRMFQTLNDHPNLTIEVFRTMKDAEAWLTEDRRP